MTNPLGLFSPNYHDAASRFREAAARIGAHLTRHPIRENADEPPLSIDVATICPATVGSATPRHTVVVSSGVHGVEGFFDYGSTQMHPRSRGIAGPLETMMSSRQPARETPRTTPPARWVDGLSRTWAHHATGSSPQSLAPTRSSGCSGRDVRKTVPTTSGHPGTRAFGRAKAQLLECFCPRSPTWRKTVVAQGLSLIARAIAAGVG